MRVMETFRVLANPKDGSHVLWLTTCITFITFITLNVLTI